MENSAAGAPRRGLPCVTEESSIPRTRALENLEKTPRPRVALLSGLHSKRRIFRTSLANGVGERPRHADLELIRWGEPRGSRRTGKKDFEDEIAAARDCTEEEVDIEGRPSPWADCSQTS